jgi:hypothetical protein
MSTDFSTGASHEPVASCATAFACLLRLSSQVCSDGEGGSVSCRGVVEGDSLPLSRLVEFAGQLGLEAKHARSDWPGLQTIGFKRSTLALLKNTNLIVLTGAGGSEGEAIAVWDPLDRSDRVHFVPREKFEAVWTGDVVIITTQLLQKSEAPNTLDFCWFTPAGLQLLGRKSDNRQRLKLLHRASENTGVQYTAGARTARQQTESVLARNSSSEPAPTTGTAMEDSSRPPLAALTGRGEWRRPVVRLYLAAAAILAIGATGLFLLRYPAADILAIAINAATKGSEEVPNSGSLVDHATTRGADRLPQSALRLRSANAIFSPPSVPNTAPTQPSPMEMRLQQPAVRVEAALGINCAPRSMPASLLGSASAGPPPEVAIPAPALPDDPAVEAAGIPPGSTAKTSSGFTKTSLATSPPPAATSAPTGSNRQATSEVPLTAPTAAAADSVPSLPQSLTGSIPGTTPTVRDAATAASDGPGAGAQDSSTNRTISTGASADPATLSKDPLPTIAAATPAPVASAASAAATVSAAAMPAPTEPSVKPRFSAAEIAALVARGDALLSTGDITSARLFYQRAADAGAGLAAVRLGETFDPAFLDRAHFRGARGDPGQAVSWYRRARDLGVTDAEVLLKGLQNN